MKLTLALSILFIFLQTKIWFGSSNIFELKALDQRILKHMINNSISLDRNQKLEEEIRKLKSKDPDTQNACIEDYARWKLGMVKKNEIFYYW